MYLRREEVPPPPEVIAERMLKNKIFSGKFTDRELMNYGPQGQKAVYKDVIHVHSSEKEFNACLRKVELILQNKSGLLSTCMSSKHRGGYILFTNLYGCPFGAHWFQVKGLTVDQNNLVNFTVKRLRSYTYGSNCWDKETKNRSLLDQFFSPNANPLKTVCDVVTQENIKQSLRFIAVVLMAMMMGCYQLLVLLFQMVHELNFLFRSLIPFFIACVESLTKAFGGLLILVAMMWKTPKAGPPKTSRTYRNANFPTRAIQPAFVSNLYAPDNQWATPEELRPPESQQ